MIAFAVLTPCLASCFQGSTPITNGYKTVNLGGELIEGLTWAALVLEMKGLGHQVNWFDRFVIDDLRP